jgi:hypothetical protein
MDRQKTCTKSITKAISYYYIYFAVDIRNITYSVNVKEIMWD